MTFGYGDVFDAVDEAVQPGDPAVHCDGQVMSWGEFTAASNSLARALIAAGLKPGAKLGQYMRNSPEYALGFVAAFKARIAPVNINYRYGPEELVYLVDNSDSEAVFFDAAFAEAVKPEPRPLPDAERQGLIDLVARRRQLVEMRAAEKIRRSQLASALRPRLDEHLAFLDAAIAELDRDTGQALRGSNAWRAQDDLLGLGRHDAVSGDVRAVGVIPVEGRQLGPWHPPEVYTLCPYAANGYSARSTSG